MPFIAFEVTPGPLAPHKNNIIFCFVGFWAVKLKII